MASAGTSMASSPGATMPSSSRPGRQPSTITGTASSAMARSIAPGASRTASGCASLERPRNTRPMSLMKEAAVPAAVSRKMRSATRSEAMPLSAWAASSAWWIMLLLTKPLNSGSPVIPAAATSISRKVSGMRRHSPPRAYMSRLPARKATAPTPRNRLALNSA